MPTKFEFNTTTVVMNNPALRVPDQSCVLDDRVREKYYSDLEEYKTSQVTLPAIWLRKTVNRPNHRCIIDNCVRQPPRSELYSYREATPYFPYSVKLCSILLPLSRSVIGYTVSTSSTSRTKHTSTIFLAVVTTPRWRTLLIFAALTGLLFLPGTAPAP